MAFGGWRGKPVEVTVKSFGEDRTYKLRPLSALEVDAINRVSPRPWPKKRVVDGETIEDDGEEFQQAYSVWAVMNEALRICAMIGAEEFRTDNPAEQVKLLMAEHTETEYVGLVAKARMVNTGLMTAEHKEAAGAALAPFEKSSASEATPD